ncbi:carboxylesterase family protein [Embleya sp. NPDC020886]|uniref:carboxylesterase family protein n=1 Tax=Embleya sp. NPDC020886 TaxID=3363980 RepID=UPI0037B7B2E2
MYEIDFETSSGRIRGTFEGGPITFPGIPYGSAIGGDNGPRLDVRTPFATCAARRPVLVWFRGATARPADCARPTHHPGFALPADDVVLVAVDRHGRALRNLLGALDWVRKDIAGFGGDPTNVTILGGGRNALRVTDLLAAPDTRGAFHRAIVHERPASIPPTAFTTDVPLLIGASTDDAGARECSGRRARSATPPVFRYRFDLPATVGGVDAPFAHGDGDPSPGAILRSTDGAARSLAQAWIEFAHTGDPNRPGASPWPPYDVDRRTTMVFGRHRAGPGPKAPGHAWSAASEATVPPASGSAPHGRLCSA